MLRGVLNGVVSSLPMLQLDYATDFIGVKLFLHEDKRKENAAIPLDGTFTSQGWMAKRGVYPLRWDILSIGFVMYDGEGFIRLKSTQEIYSTGGTFKTTAMVPFGGSGEHTKVLIAQLLNGKVVGVPVQTPKTNMAFDSLLTFKLTKAGQGALSVWNDTLLEQGKI